MGTAFEKTAGRVGRKGYGAPAGKKLAGEQSQVELHEKAPCDTWKTRMRLRASLFLGCLCYLWLCCFAAVAAAQSHSQPTAPAAGKTSSGEKSKSESASAKQLEQNFFAVLREGDAIKFLSYVPAGGVNVGTDAQHLTRAEVEQQLTRHEGLYCKLFDSACLTSEIRLDQSNVRPCSYRELLTKSQDLRTAATETTRNGVRQAILVARMKNDNCAGVGLVDFIFNLQADGWKLFSIP